MLLSTVCFTINRNEAIDGAMAMRLLCVWAKTTFAQTHVTKSLDKFPRKNVKQC